LADGQSTIATILTWILLVALVAGAGAFIAIPVLRRQRVTRRGDERSRALIEKDSAIQLIRELEQDLQTGKMDEEEYAQQRAAAEAEAIRAMKQMETTSTPGTGDDLETLVRAERARIQKETRG
jgi:cytochrome c-type biogenesis protein CcmI